MAEIMQYQKKRDDNPAFREALRKIWLSGFDDAPGYFDFFYEKRVRTGQAEIFCALSGAQAVGAAYFLPAEIRRPGVPPAKGILRLRLCHFTGVQRNGHIPEAGPCLLPVCGRGKSRNPFLPGERKAAPILYRKRHRSELYRAAGSIFGGRVCTDDRRGALRELLPEESELYKEIRDTAFQENDFLCWDTDAVKYALEENRYCGGFCKIWNIAGKNYLLFGKKEKDGSRFGSAKRRFRLVF